MRILVIRRGALGDVIITLPLMLNLKKIYPRSYIEVVGEESYWILGYPWLLDKITASESVFVKELYDEGALSSKAIKYFGNFDLIICFIVDPEVVRHKFNGLSKTKFILRNPFFDGCHIIDYTNSILDELYFPEHKINYPRLSFTEDERNEAGTLLASYDKNSKLAAIHPRTYGFKGLSLNIYLEIADFIKKYAEVIWILGPAEEDNQEIIQNIYGKYTVMKINNLKSLAAVLSLTDLYFGCDTGISHMSAATNINTLVLFGPTNPDVWGPRGENVQLLKTGNLENLNITFLKDIIYSCIDHKIGTRDIIEF